MEGSNGDTTKADYWVDTSIDREIQREETGQRLKDGGGREQRERDGTPYYNQNSRTQNCGLGGNSGLARKTVLNFPKMDETRPSDKRENGRPESVSHFDRRGCCSSSFVPPPDLAQVFVYFIIFGGR